IDFCGVFTSDSSCRGQLVFAEHARTACRIHAFFDRPFGMFGKKLIALTDGNRGGLYRLDILYFHTWQYEQTLLTMKLYFANYMKTVVAQKVVVRKNTSSNGVFNGHHYVICFSLFQHITSFFERLALEGFDVFAKILDGCFFVK